MKTVPLYGKKAASRVALVDDADYPLVMQYRWYVQEDKRKGRPRGPYAVTAWLEGGRQMNLRMHKLLTGWPQTDHHDGNGLNNQRSNLRLAGGPQNHQNQRKTTQDCSSQYKGVSWDRHRGKWQAYITIDGRRRALGRFRSEAAAAAAYDAAAIAAFGDFARTNLGAP